MSRLIDADDLIGMVKPIVEEDEFRACTIKTMKMIILDMIDDAPTADATPVVHGHWIGKPLAGYSTVKCSACGSAFVENNGKWKYCPDCGAKMDEVTE